MSQEISFGITRLCRRTWTAQILVLVLLTGVFSLGHLLTPTAALAVRTIAISNAADPSSYPAPQGATGQLIDNFTVATSGTGAGVTITNFYVTTTGTTNIAAVYVSDATGATTYGSQTVPSGNVWTISSATVPSNPGGTFTVYIDVKATATLNATLTADLSSFDWTSGTGTVATDTAGTIMTIVTACTRNNPTVTITTTNQSVTTDGGTVNYNFTVKNNDSATCGSSTFTLAAADSNLTNFNATSGPTSGSVTLAPGVTSSSISYTVNAKAGQTSGSNTTTISAAEASHTTSTASSITTLSVISSDQLTHNSANLGTTYGTWGTAYNCTTCHNDDTTNIKLVNTSIGTPIGNRPVVFMQITATGSVAAVMGNDQRTAYLNGSRNVCEVCHHQTTVHNYSASKVGADKNHKSANNDNCTKCHAHKAGFKAVCDTCHGNPPLATTLGGPNGLVNPATTVLGASPTDSGAHDKHVTLEGMGCDTCHYNNANHNGNNVLIGFAINGTNFPGFAGTVPATPYATYSGNSGAAKPTASSDINTKVYNTASTRNSCNVYCHGNWAGANGSINPSWMQPTGQADCNTCHGASAARPPQTGSHLTHASRTPGNYAFSCTKCHPSAGSGSSVTYSHIDGSVQWRLSSATTNGLVGTSAAAYKTLNSGSTGAVAPSSSFGSCANIYCHSNAQASGGSGAPSSYATPTWGGASVNCGSCHVDMSSSGSTTGDHAKHSQSYRYACKQCHKGYTFTTITTTTHVNRNIDLDFSAGNAATTTYSKNNSFIAGSDVYGNCTNSYCHSNGQSDGAKGAIYRQPTWGTTATNCGSCHNNMATLANATSGSHTKHANTSTGYSMTCSLCHGTGYTATYANTTTHVNKLINLGFTGNAAGTTYTKTSPFAPASGAYGNCGNNYCHSTANGPTGSGTVTYATPTWGGTTTCSSCHKDMYTDATAPGDHVKHAQSTAVNYNFACSVCHGSGYTNSAVPFGAGTRHVDKFINISTTGTLALGTVYSKGSRFASNSAYGTCSVSYCHSNGQSDNAGPRIIRTTPAWGSTSLNCGSCHNNMKTFANASSGSHVKHAQGNAKYDCDDCHSGYTSTTVNTVTHVNKKIDLGFSGNATGTTYSKYSAAGFAPGKGKYGKCSTNKCHGQGIPIWGGSLYSNTNACENCHGSAATNPFYSTGTGTGAAPVKVTAANDSKVGAHLTHMTSMYNYSKKVACKECHVVPTLATMTSHYRTGTATLTFGSLATTGSLNPAYSSGTCTNTYCHGASLNGNTGRVEPVWNNTSYMTGTPGTVGNGSSTRGTGDCSVCHAYPPMTSSHGNVTATQCITCHVYVNSTGTGFTNRTTHINGIINAQGHSVPIWAGATLNAGHTGCLTGIGCHANTNSSATYPTSPAAPDCRACHRKADPTVSTNGCGSCHGAANGNGQPNGTTHPDAVGSHVEHAPYAACAECHTGGAGSQVSHGPGNKGTNPAVVDFVTTVGWNSTNSYCTATYCHSNGQSDSANKLIYRTTPVWGAVVTLNCGSCHNNMKTFANASSGSHVLHAQTANYDCVICHSGYTATTVNAATHADQKINLGFTSTGSGTVYSKYSATGFAPGKGKYGSCSVSNCHGGAAVKITWGADTTRPECFKCHGSTATTGFVSYSSANVAPGGGTAGRDLAGNTAKTAPRVGSHQAHLTAPAGISNTIHCSMCHNNHATVTDASHFNYTSATVTFSGLAKVQSHTPTVSRVSGEIQCTNTYCHTGKSNTGTRMSPFFNDTSVGTTMTMTRCKQCHGMPPGDTNHTGYATLSAFPTGGTCGCHANMTTNGTTYANIFTDETQHLNGAVELLSGHATLGSNATAYLAHDTGCTTGYGCHTSTNNTASFPWPMDANKRPPDCRACHKKADPRTTPNCGSCHGSGTTGRPSGSTYPDIAGKHSNHSMACTTCHVVTSNNKAHGPSTGYTNTVDMAPGAYFTPTTQGHGTCATGSITCSGGSHVSTSTW